LIPQHKTAALEFSMKLYVTFTSPYARLARILVLEKALEDRVEIIAAKTRATDSPYYRINPSGRVPYLIDDSGVGMEDSQLICAYLDSLDGKPVSTTPSAKQIGLISGLSSRRATCVKESAYGYARWLDPQTSVRPLRWHMR
jgi:hypothetical protein